MMKPTENDVAKQRNCRKLFQENKITGNKNKMQKGGKMKRKTVFYIVIFFVSIFFAAEALAAESGNICNEGCSLDAGCGSAAPYLCKKSWSADICVAKGYDSGYCGGKTDKGGYCFECSGGCALQSELGGQCGLFTTCNADEYCCKRAEWYASNTCKPKYSDMGCCGGPPSGGDKTTFLKASITNNKADACTSKIKWEVKAKGSASFTDYSADCVQDNPEVTIGSKKSMEASCTSQKLPQAASGPHKEKITWCGESAEIEYGQSQTADISVILKYPETYGQPSAKTLKLTCKKEILGNIQPVEVVADYESINLGNGLQVLKFKFAKEKLQQLKDAGCSW